MSRPQFVEPFAVASHHIGGQHHVCPAGELDVATAPMLERDLSRAEQGGAERIILDLRRLTFIDSSGLHLLERAHQRSLSDGNRLGVIAGSATVQRTLHLAAIGRRLPFIASDAGSVPARPVCDLQSASASTRSVQP